MQTLWQDLRYGLRLLRKHPGFTAVSLLTLALGIGANTAIFQLLNAVRLRTLPVDDPQELCDIRIADPRGSRGNWSSWHATLTNPIWEQIQKHQQPFSGTFAWGSDPWMNLATGGEARFAQTLWVSGDFFRTLGIRPIIGRVFSTADDQRGCAPGAVISYSFWQREFGGDVSVVGKTLNLESHPFEVLGVTPASFFGLEVGRSFDVALPICAERIFNGERSRLDDGTEWWLAAGGRLKPGWSQEQANANLSGISPGVFEASLPSNYPADDVKSYLGFKLQTHPAGTGVSQLREPYENPLWLLLAIAGLVLLIACANLANLTLARASAREREVALRLALGASRARLIRQLMAESFPLAVAGAALGAVVASDLSGFLISLISTEGSPLFLDLGMDWHVLAFTAGVSVLTCVLFGLMPAVRATRITPGAVIKSGGRGLTAGRERLGFQRALVVSQVAISLVLVVAALLFSRSLGNLLTVDTGLEQNGLFVMYVNPADMKIPADRRLAFKQELLDRIRRVPGVQSAAHASVVPLSGGASENRIWPDGSDSARAGSSYHSRISPDYFKATGTPLLAGRDFDQRDRVTSANVAIVNETFARRVLNVDNPVGRRFWIEATPTDPETLYEIVGLARDSKYLDIREDPASVFYRCSFQDPHPGMFNQVLIRSNAPAAEILSAAKAAVSEINPAIVITSGVFRTQVEDSLLRERLMAILSAFFGGLALLLACFGLFGMMSWSVAGRTTEIGIRAALGAQSRDVLWLILGEALLLAAVGVAAGLAAAFFTTRLVSALLFGLSPADPVSIILATLLMLAVALAAGYIPARRATKVDPIVALRYE